MSEENTPPSDDNRPTTEDIEGAMDDVAIGDSGSKPEESKPDDAIHAAAAGEPAEKDKAEVPAPEAKAPEEAKALKGSEPKEPDESQPTQQTPVELQEETKQPDSTPPAASQEETPPAESKPSAASQETNRKSSESEQNSPSEETEEIALGGPNFGGLYQHVRSEKMEEYLRENGANFMVRKLAARSNPDLEIWQDGEHFVIKTISAFMTRETEFTIGQEYIEKQPNGIEFKCISSWEGKTLVTVFEPKVEGKGKSQKVTRELNGTEFTQTMELGEIVAKRIFKMKARQKSPESEPEKVKFADPNNPFKGKYKHLKDDNFEEVLQAFGMPYIMRKVVSKTSPSVEVDQDGDHFVFSMVSTFITKKSEFRIGEEFEDTSPNGIVFKAVASWDDERVKIQLTPKEEGKGKPQSAYRELVGDQLLIRFEIGDVKGGRMFERVG